MFSGKHFFIVSVFMFATVLVAGPMYDDLRVDNIFLDGNTISTADTNGDLIIAPDGSGNIQLSSYSGVLKASSGVLSASNLDLTSEVDGALPIANGGTNSSTALTNDKVMVSSAGSIAESGTIDTTELGYLDGVTSLIQGQIDGKVGLSGDETVAGIKTFSSAAVFSSGITSGGTNNLNAATNALHLGISGEFKVNGSTPSRPCPHATQAEIDAYTGMLDGACFYNTDTKRINTYDSATSKWVESGSGGGGGSAGINFVPDDSFEDETLNPDTLTGSSETYQNFTADADLYSEGKNEKYFRSAWTGLSSADLYLRDSFARTGLDNKNGLFSIWIKTSASDIDICVRTDDSTFAAACDSNLTLDINGDGSWHKYEIPFVFGASTVEYEIFNESFTGDATIEIDKVYVGTYPDGYIQSINDVDTDSVSFTPTFEGFGTVSTSELTYHRDGSHLVVSGYFISGTPTATEARIHLPNSLTVAPSHPGNTQVGTYARNTSSSNNGGLILATAGEAFVKFSSPNVFGGTVNTATVDANGDAVLAPGNAASVTFSVPIQGWETGRTNVTQQRVNEISFTISGSSDTHTTSASFEKIDFNAVEDDTASIYNSSLKRVEIPESGKYDATAQIGMAASATGIRTAAIFKNGTMWREGVVQPGSAEGNIAGISLTGEDLNKGDYLEVFLYQNSGGSLAISSNTAQTFFQVSKRQDLMSGYFRDDQFKKVEDKFVTTETKWGKWNGKQLYRRCFEVASDIDGSAGAVTTTLYTWATGLTPVGVIGIDANTFFIDAFVAAAASDAYAQISYNKSTGNIVAQANQYLIPAGTSFCMEYTK